MTDKELDRNVARRLAIIKHAQEVTGNVALTCRYYGISRSVFYTWYRRYEEEGLAEPPIGRGRNFLARVLCTAVISLPLMGTLRMVIGLVSAVILG